MRTLIVMVLIALGAIVIQPKPSEAGVRWGWGGCCGYYYQPCCYSYYNYYARPYYGYYGNYGYRNYRPYYGQARRVNCRWDRRGW